MHRLCSLRLSVAAPLVRESTFHSATLAGLCVTLETALVLDRKHQVFQAPYLSEQDAR